MNHNNRLQQLFLKGILCDLELRLEDNSQFIIIKVHKVILAAHSSFFSKLFTFGATSDKATVHIPNVTIANDIILSFYGLNPINSLDWSYELSKAKILDYFGLDVSIPVLAQEIDPKDFDFILSICAYSGFDDKSLEILARNIPVDYDLSTLSNDLLSAMISNNGSYRIILNGGSNKKVLDIETGLEIGGGSYHASDIYFSPNNKYIVTIDTYCNILDAYTNELLYAFSLEVYSVSFAPNSKHLAIAFVSAFVQIFDLEIFKFVHTIEQEADGVDYSTDGANIILQLDTKSRLYETNGWNLLHVFDSNIIFSNHPEYLISKPTACKNIKIWNVLNHKDCILYGSPCATSLGTKIYDKKNIENIAYVSIESDSKYEIRRMGDAKLISTIPYYRIFSQIFSACNTFIAFKIYNYIEVRNILTGEIVYAFGTLNTSLKRLKRTPFSKILFTPDSEYFIVQYSTEIKILNIKDRSVVCIENVRSCEQLNITPNSKYVITKSPDNTIEVRSIKSAKLVHKIRCKKYTDYSIYDNIYYNDKILRLVKEKESRDSKIIE